MQIIRGQIKQKLGSERMEVKGRAKEEGEDRGDTRRRGEKLLHKQEVLINSKYTERQKMKGSCSPGQSQRTHNSLDQSRSCPAAMAESTGAQWAQCRGQLLTQGERREARC